MTTHTNILQRRDDIFLPEHLDTFYTLDRFHTNGGRILSRSFHLEHFTGEGDGVEEGSACMDVDPEPVDVDAQSLQNTEEGMIDIEDFEEDECADVADVAMTPMADILNARNGHDNVCFIFVARRCIDILSGTPVLREELFKHGSR